MSEGDRQKQNKNLQTSMETQLFSMLKEVMDEVTEEDLPIHDFIFTQKDSDEDKEDLNTTSTNTTLMTQCDFARDSHDKSLTTKGLKPIIFNKTHFDFYSNEQLSRKTTRKFQTLNANTINEFSIQTIQNNNNTSNAFYTQAINQQCPIQSQYGNNWNPIMPIKAFNFNTFPQQQNNNYFYYNQQKTMMNNFSQNFQQSQLQTQYYNNEESIISALETVLINSASFDNENYIKFKGHFVQLIKNQQASRICQFYLDKTSKDIIHMIFQEIITFENLCKLLYDPYANYFLLKMFYFLDKEDRITFLNLIINDIENACVNKISTYPIQCIVEHLNSRDEKLLIMSSIVNHLMKLSSDIYGTHVIEKILTYFDYDITKPITQFIIDNFLYLATNANGLCIVKKVIIFEYEKDFFPRIRTELEQNALALIENPFGNYALQMALDNWDVEYTESIMIKFLGHCTRLSIQKFSSNVIERCIEKSECFCMNFIGEVCFNCCSISCLMKNNFGNYVIQTALKSINPNNKMLLLNSIERNLEHLTEKNVIRKWRGIVTAHSHV